MPVTSIVKTDGMDRGSGRTETEGNQKNTGKQGRYGSGMVGAIIRDYGRCPEYSEILRESL